MTDAPIAIVRTSTANLASVRAGFRRFRLDVRVVEHADQMRPATHVVLPGVGAFRPAMECLRRGGLDIALREHLAADKPTLCICLGLQLLCEASEESPGVAGLGVIAGSVTRLNGGIRVPQLGWNRVQAARSSRFVTDGYAYFANSFKLDRTPPDWTVAEVEYGGRWIAALERGNTLACQFHPELSGAWGHGLLGRWLAGTGARRVASC